MLTSEYPLALLRGAEVAPFKKGQFGDSGTKYLAFSITFTPYTSVKKNGRYMITYTWAAPIFAYGFNLLTAKS